LTLPPLAALELREDAWSSYAAAHLAVAYGGPFFTVVLLAFGLWPALLVRREDPTRGEMFVASGVRAGLAVVSALSCVLLIVPPDLAYPLGPTWLMLTWIAGLGLPLWANALFLRIGGKGAGTTLVRTLTLTAISIAGVVLAAVVLVLPITGMIVPFAVGGTVYALSMALAAWRNVSGPRGVGVRAWIEVVGVTAVISIGVALTLALRIANPPLDTLKVENILGFDPSGQRIAFGVVRSSSQLHSAVELDLRTGAWLEFGRRDTRIVYAAGRRVIARRSGLAYTLGVAGPIELCRETPAGMACGPSLQPGRGLMLRGHDRESLIVAHRESELIAWNVEDDRRWQVERPGGKIHWPCFVAGPSLYYRVQYDQPPYDQELLLLEEPGAAPTRLGLTHGLGCDDKGRTPPRARFDRGRRRANRPPSVHGEGLPADGFILPELVVSAAWSDDGQVLAMVMESAHVRYYRADLGVTDPQPVESIGPLRLNSDGTLAANQFREDGRGFFSVRTVPDHEVVVERQRCDGPVVWDSANRLVTMLEGQLVRVDPRTRTTDVLFPPTVR
jgi:hypothetical protein